MRARLRQDLGGIPALGPRGEGWVLIQTILLVGVVVAGVVGARWPENLLVPALVIAIISGAAGLWLAVSAIGTLGKSVSPFPKPPATSELKESGVYGLVRHPIYGGILLLSWRGRWHSVPGRLSLPARSPSPLCSSHASRSDGSSIATPLTRATEAACVAASFPTSGEEDGNCQRCLRHEKRISVYEGFSWVIEDEIPKHAGCFATPYITTDADATAKNNLDNLPRC